MNTRINEKGAITLVWLEDIVEEMESLTSIWPYLTIKGFINAHHNTAVSLDEVVRFMKDSDYKLIYVYPNENNWNEIVFKREIERI
ncbi:hypothetical protein [Virgibacillus halodenitrificans]|uniref:hypothetical protein n=1 Tax=Virgibacillus halodenitrificans TaxID=1482 RepID=UPI000EF49C6F|nr:hypothetical protein [Virgibacillus halodenitrificans]